MVGIPLACSFYSAVSGIWSKTLSQFCTPWQMQAESSLMGCERNQWTCRYYIRLVHHRRWRHHKHFPAKRSFLLRQHYYRIVLKCGPHVAWKWGDKNCVPLLTQPGSHLLEHHCAVFYHFCTGHATHVFLKVVAGPFILHLIDGHPSRIVHFGFIIVQLYLLAIKETVGLCKKWYWSISPRTLHFCKSQQCRD